MNLKPIGYDLLDDGYGPYLVPIPEKAIEIPKIKRYVPLHLKTLLKGEHANA